MSLATFGVIAFAMVSNTLGDAADMPVNESHVTIFQNEVETHINI